MGIDALSQLSLRPAAAPGAWNGRMGNAYASQLRYRSRRLGIAKTSGDCFDLACFDGFAAPLGNGYNHIPIEAPALRVAETNRTRGLSECSRVTS
jgi:hypothetical protein